MLNRVAYSLVSALALLMIAAPSGWASASNQCPPPGWTEESLAALKASQFEIADNLAREQFAQDVVACLASPDPELRDGIAFEALSHMLRADQLGTDVRALIAQDLLARLNAEPGPSPDPGFERPFAALALSEIVRADMIAAYLPPELRDAIADAAVAYMRAIDDYRGFDEGEGWRHGVAHAADLLMQLVRNKSVVGTERLVAIRDAVAAQLSPPGHSYIYGEPERLMRPIIMLAQRGTFNEGEWVAWFEGISAPAPFASWEEVFGSQAGLAKLHNLRAFLYAVWINARLSESTDDDVLLAGAEAALRRIP